MSQRVDYAQPNYVYSANTVTPNDQFYTNPGQPALPKIKAPEAWSITTGNHDVVVAVADSGANISHPDFVNRLSPGWYNFVAGGTDVKDDFFPVYHGSNVAGIVGAQGNNGPDPGSNGGYMAGVAWDVRLLIIKVLDQNGGGNSVWFAQGIDYAYTSDQGHPPAIAINCSWGLTPASTIDSTLAGAIDRARAHNMVVVTAAGNSHLNCELPGNLISPASCPKDNIIAVGATRVRPDDPIRDDTKTDFSNFGKYRVELGAPGGEDPPNDTLFGVLGLSQLLLQNGVPAYTKISGTSMAAPHVTGALALVKSQYPWEDYVGIRDRVIMGTDDLAALNPDGPTPFRTGGRLDLEKALQKRTLIRNFSTRAKVESGDRIVIGGFNVGGSSEPCGAAPLAPCLKVAIRGLGPTMNLGVPVLNDPQLILYDSSGTKIADNDNWHDLPPDQILDLAANNLTPGANSESAMVRVLPAGNYTAQLVSHDGSQGVGRLEIWELSGNTNEKMRLRNVSARCPVGVGDEVAIAGLQVGDSTPNPARPKRRLLMRGRGPILGVLGLSGTLADPMIELRDLSGALMDSNNQWPDIDGTGTGLEDKLKANSMAPQCFISRSVDPCTPESALWPSLAQGVYTAVLKGVNNGTGIGLIEFLEY